MITMRQNTPEGIYRLAFQVYDHKHSQNSVAASVIIIVKHLPYERVINSASLRIAEMSDEDFIKQWNHAGSKLEHLKILLGEILNIEGKNVDIFSVQQYRRHPPLLDIFFSVGDTRHHRPEKINGLLQIHEEEIEKQIGVHIVMAGINHCFSNKVKCQGPCVSNFRTSSQPHLVDANMTSLVGLTVVVTAECESNPKKLSAETCHEHYCFNGGHCLQKGNTIRCVCPDEFRGPRCQQTVRSFQDRGWAWLPSLHPQTDNHLSLEFLTTKENGVLLYNGPLSFVILSKMAVSDYIALEIRIGEPRLLMKLGDATVELLLKVKEHVNDGKWHQVDVFWNYENVRLVLDHCRTADVIEMRDMMVSLFNGTSCLAKRKLPLFSGNLLLNSPLQIGGIYWNIFPQNNQKWNSSLNTASFEGCIRNLFYNGEILDLSDTLLSKSTEVGCIQTQSTCKTVECSGHGICRADLTSAAPQCWCDAGWSGPSCTTPTKPVTFLPHSYIKFALAFEVAHFTTFLQLRFRTEEPNGELFRLSDQHSQEYAILEIKNGNLYFKYNLNSVRIEEKYICLCYVSVDDGFWHTAKVSRYGSVSVLQLDGGEFIRYNQTSLFEGHQWLVIDKQEGVHAGGKAEYTGMNTLEIYADYRNGCVDDIRLDGRALPLPPAANVTQWGQATVALNLEYGCVFSPECSFIICSEPVNCNDELRQTKCVCSDAQVLASSSKDCTKNKCEKTHCSSPGQCSHQNKKFNYNCQCSDGVTGMNCKYLGDQSTATFGTWGLTAVVVTVVLIIVLIITFVIYKYRCSIHKKSLQMKHERQENKINCSNEEKCESSTNSFDMKPLKIPFNGEESLAAVELHSVKGDSSGAMRCLMDQKNQIDADILSETNDELRVYVYEGGVTVSSSLSSLCAGLQCKLDTVNLEHTLPPGTLLEKQCQTEA